MGKTDVEDYLMQKRLDGDNTFYTIVEIHQGIKDSGKSLSYVSVWHSIDVLYRDGVLEASFIEYGIMRKVRFRARFNTNFRSSHISTVYTTNGLPKRNDSITLLNK